MLEDILGYKTEEFFGYKREKRKLFSKGNREEFLNMILEKNELFDKVSQIISSYDSCLISYSTERFKNSELAEVQIIVFPKDFQFVLENRRMLETGKIVIKADTVVTNLVFYINYKESGSEYTFEANERYFHEFSYVPGNRTFAHIKKYKSFSIMPNDLHNAKIMFSYKKKTWFEDIKFNTAKRLGDNFLGRICNTFMEILLKDNWFFHDMVKDLEKGNKLTPYYKILFDFSLTFTKALKYNSVKEFLATKGKVTGSIRKMPIALSYNILKSVLNYEPAIKFCIENQEKVLMTLIRSIEYMQYIKEKHRKEVTLCAIFSAIQNGNNHFINDTVRMAESLGEPLNYRRLMSANSTRKYHDRLFEKLYDKTYFEKPDRKLIIPEHFVKLSKQLEGYELIDTLWRLMEESREQNNCVLSYENDIEAGNCAIFSYTHNLKRYTIEIVRENNEYKIKQFLGKYNSSNYTEEHIISLEKKLNEINLKQILT